MRLSENTIVMRIGLDDTDHPDFGCTTERMDNLIQKIIEKIGARIIERRLVRLWPFAERRTRGNGALGALIEINRNELQAFVNVCKIWFSETSSTIESYPKTEFEPSPCLVISQSPTPESWYWDSVRGAVDVKNRIADVSEHDCTIIGSGLCWGVVGASAAISWRPNDSSSWELIAWRKKSLIGTHRKVSKKAVSELELNHPETFVNRDPTKGKSMIAPRTPCPVLYGIRGSSKDAVSNAHEWLQERSDVEESHSFAAHLTNQLSDDHIESISSGTIISPPVETKGGHSYAIAFSGEKNSRIVAFSEGGPVNRLLRSLNAGDIVSWTGLESPDGAIHLEKLRLDDRTPIINGRPKCCSRTMRSLGKGQDLRCKICDNRMPRLWITSSDPEESMEMVGKWVEPNPSNRRHLSRPISLGLM